jgi:hypothetical protein
MRTLWSLSLKWWFTKLLYYQHTRFPSHYSCIQESSAICSNTCSHHGLPLLLDIARFTCLATSSPYPTAIIQGLAIDRVWLCAIQKDLRYRPCRLVAHHFKPFRSRVGFVGWTELTKGRRSFHYINSLLPCVYHANERQLFHLNGNITTRGRKVIKERY